MKFHSNQLEVGKENNNLGDEIEGLFQKKSKNIKGHPPQGIRLPIKGVTPSICPCSSKPSLQLLYPAFENNNPPLHLFLYKPIFSENRNHGVIKTWWLL